MYRYEASEEGGFDILGEEDDVLANVQSEGEAECLISHLNRGM